MNNTLHNGFDLLARLAASGQDVSVTELAAQAALPPSHVCRLLKTLVQTGYVEQNPATRKYYVSLKLLNLAHARLVSLDFRRIGHPFAVRLADTLQAHAYLSQPLQGRSIVVDVAYPRGAIADAGIVVGLIHSVFHSACGKVCAAFAAADDRERLLREDAGAAGGATVRSRWNEEFARIRATRLAVRSEDEVLALAAPLFRAEGRFCGALGVFLPPGARLTPAIERSVRRTAEALSFALGYPYSQ